MMSTAIPGAIIPIGMRGQSTFDINESFVVPQSGHVTHLDCKGLHTTVVGKPKTVPTCRGDLSIEEIEGV